MSSLKDEKTKLSAIAYAKEGFSVRDIAQRLDIPRTTLHDFLAENTFKSWWKAFKEGDTGDLPEIAGPKILVGDIETSPLLVYVWGIHNQYITPDRIHTDWEIICFCAKWLGKEEIFVGHIKDYYQGKISKEEAIVAMLEILWKLLDECDIFVAQNGKKFDVRKINAKFKEYGFPPPSPYKVVDTYLISRAVFGFTSNKLDYISKLFGFAGKVEHEGFPLWIKCLEGDKAAWDKMLEYNEGDIIELENVYLEVRAWDQKHPNLGLYHGDNLTRCNKCGSPNIELVEEKTSKTNVSTFALYRCLENACGALSRGRKNLLPKEKREALLMNIT